MNFQKSLRRCLIVVLSGFSLLAIDKSRRVPDVVDPDGAVTLPNGWRITPAGEHLKLPGDFPLEMVVSADGSKLLVNTGGFHDHSLSVIDLRTQTLTARLNVAKTWAGMAFDPATGIVYLSGGGQVIRRFDKVLKEPDLSQEMKDSVDKPILRALFTDGKLTAERGLSIAGLPEKDRYISGMTIGPDHALYVLSFQTDTLYRLSGPELSQQTAVKTGYRPYSVAFSPDGKTLAVSNWGDKSASLFKPETLEEISRITVRSQPSEIAWSRDGRLFVTNAGSNDVSVISGNSVIETIRTSIDPRAPIGSTPDALALSPDGHRLYVANAGNNNVAVIDISGREESRVLGFIPTGWYPSTLAVSPDGERLFVGTAKGMNFGTNYPAQTSLVLRNYNPKTPFDYIGQMLTGHVSIVNVPDKKQLAVYTKRSIANVPVPASYVNSAEATKIQREALSKIHHVPYIIRENRTYDQVFGDLGKGNGDPNLVFFGETVTPNAHALARRFVTLDNLYCDGEVSEDGHQWSNAAYATDFNQKAWTTNYGSRGEPQADERLMSSPAGYLWDACARHHLTFRTYGEMASFTSSPDSAPQVKAVGSLAGHVSLEWLQIAKNGGRDTDKAAVFIRELKEAEKTGEWPNFMVMSLVSCPSGSCNKFRWVSFDGALGITSETG
jgi:YVTN family beta-propeller protein